MTVVDDLPVEHRENVINLRFHPGKEKPWVLDYHDVNLWQTARAAVNYPVTEFESKEKAIEVATMLRDIIHADAVEIETPDGTVVDVLDDVEKAKFFETVHSSDDDVTGEDKAWDVVNGLDEETIRANQERVGSHKLDTDSVRVPGPSQRQAEAEMGL